MNASPIDIIIIVFIFFISLIGYKNAYTRNISKIFNLLISIILTNLILSNLSTQFLFLRNSQDFIFLSLYLIIFIIFMTLIGFIGELIIEQINEIKIELYLDRGISIIIGIIKGFVLISFLIFIFDMIPYLSTESRNTVYTKFETKSFLFKPCNNLKEILFNR